MPRHNNRPEPVTGSPTKAGWRVREWGADTGLSKPYIYILISKKAISSVKSGNARIITTAPAAYLASLSNGPA